MKSIPFKISVHNDALSTAGVLYVFVWTVHIGLLSDYFPNRLAI
jgi:hypothetical protein